MDNKNFEVYFDCGFSKIRVCAFNKHNPKNIFCAVSESFLDHSNIDFEIQNIISSLEKDTKEYLDNINLMIDSPKMISVGISISKKLEGSKLKKEDVKFLVQEAKQQVIKSYPDKQAVHIIIQNYKIDDTHYTFLPDDINCNLISLDILFICLPKKTIEYFKKLFFKLNISVNKFFCSTYVKSINYKDNFLSAKEVSFVDIGFKKTSIACYSENKIISIDVLPIGSNHITSDISKILKVDLQEAENIKLFFDKKEKFLNKKKISLDLIQQIIFARTEEILELCAKSIKSNLNLVTLKHHKMILMGEGSKILDNKCKEKISFSTDIDYLEETTEDICQSALKLAEGLNKQEVLMIPKKQIKQGFFENLFHLFK